METLVPDDISKYDILGVRVADVDVHSLTARVFAPDEGPSPRVFAHVNLHGLFLFERSEAMRDLLAAANLVHIDGTPIVWIGRALGYPLGGDSRVTYVDWLPVLLEEAQRRSAGVFLVGGKPGVSEQVAHQIRRQYTGIRFGHHHGYLSDPLEEEVLRSIQEFKPDVLFVGMGMPRQEEWILANMDRLPGCAVLPCGACFDYFTGTIPTPPRFLGPLGLEWLFRLATDPLRLWRRYIMEPMILLPRVVKEVIASRDMRAPLRGRLTPP